MNRQLLCGVKQVKKAPMEPYSEIVCAFLDDFAEILRKDVEAKKYPDVMSFAFWARKANVIKHKEEYCNRHTNEIRLGKGTIFHIAPSNVPVNFMFSYAFGLLAGNANVVRVPSRDFPQVTCMCKRMEEILNLPRYSQIRDMTSFVRYGHNQEITDEYSDTCNVRVIWGGDTTIADIRKSPLSPRATEITFADRYSFGVISVKQLQKATDQEINNLAEKFYNDTYLMDQNACSTPHLICFKRDGRNNDEVQEQQKRFWKQVYLVAEKYDLADIKVSEKYAMLCEKILGVNTYITGSYANAEEISDADYIKAIHKYDNLLYVCEVDTLQKTAIDFLRGKYGLFYQYVFDEWGELSCFSDEKVQTMAYYGIEANDVVDYVVQNNFVGIDRIVPFGKTLDIDVIWDGCDLIDAMSRIIDR